MNNEDIKNKFNDALDSFIKDDHELLWLDANERSISHKFAEHLQREFPDWHVDCEYNRLDRERQAKAIDISKDKWKKLVRPDPVREISYEDLLVAEDHPTVFPDIIVHHRGIPDNLLVIEIKKSHSADIGWDEHKLDAYIRILDYKAGVLLVFVTKVKSKRREDLIQELSWSYS